MVKKSHKQKRRDKLRKRNKKRKQKSHTRSSSSELDVLKHYFSKYEQEGLIATLGGLQLAPENHTHLFRLETASQVACSLRKKSKITIDTNELRTQLNKILPTNGSYGMAEDPTESLFTENIIFHGGNYIVYSGITDGGSFILKNLLMSIFHQGKGLDLNFKAMVKCTAMALLTISNGVANRLGHMRNIISPDTWRENIHVPDIGEVIRLRDAVMFSQLEISDLFQRLGLEYKYLLPFLSLAGDSNLNADDPNNNPLFSKPLVQIGERIILAQPGSITSALRHYIFVTAQSMGLIEKLAGNYRKVLCSNVEASFKGMFYKNVEINLPPLEKSLPIEEKIYRIDTDKLAHVQIIVDNASNYDRDEVFGHWVNKELVEKLETRRENISKQLLDDPNINCSKVLLVIVLGGIGRFTQLGIKNDPDNTLTVAMSAEDLEILSNLRDYDSLTIWKYAGAEERFHQLSHVSLGMFSFLDVFALYLNYHHSFNLSDEGLVIPMLQVGYGHELRIKSVMTSDIHAVLLRPKGLNSRYVTVTRRYEGDPIPIYMLYDSLSPFIQVVKSYKQPLWVLRDSLSEYNSSDLDDVYFKVTDLFVYWLWQVAPSLKSHLEPLGETPINIDVRLDKPEQWANISLVTTNEVSKECTYTVNGFDITFSIPAGIQMYFGKSDNEGERLILDKLLQAFNVMLGQHRKTQSLTEHIRYNILQAHAPLGPKKMLSFFHHDRAALNPNNLQSLRKLQEHNLEEQLDGLVEELDDKTLVVGEVKDKKKRLELVGKIVDLYLNRLRSILPEFTYQPLLEQLISNNEAAQHRRVKSLITMAIDIACFSDINTRVEREKEEKVSITTAAVATRTLIEFIAAEPPEGKRFISKDDLDKLLAIAFQFFNWGSYYDQIKLGVFDHRLSILKSGRIGRDHETLQNFRNAFLGAKVREEIEKAISGFEAFITPKNTQDAEYPDHDLATMNDAFVAEFGLTMVEVKEFHTCLMDIGFEQKKACANLPLSKLKQAIREKVKHIADWTDTKITEAIQLYSLTPRERWEAVPSDFLPSDIYPWRYNRRLSYTYRPLIIGPLPKDDPLVFWGPRNVEESCRLLFSNISNGRYKLHNNSSEKMESFLGHIRENLGKSFTSQVKKWFETNTDWPVESEIFINQSSPLKAGLNLGDIDVLAIDHTRQRIYSIECKDINYGRNPREMASELERFINESENGKSWVEKHIKRDRWLKENTGKLSLIFKQNVSVYEVCSVFITSEELPAPYLTKMPLPFFAFTMLKREGVKILDM